MKPSRTPHGVVMLATGSAVLSYSQRVSFYLSYGHSSGRALSVCFAQGK